MAKVIIPVFMTLLISNAITLDKTHNHRSIFFEKQGILIEPVGVGSLNQVNILTKVAVALDFKGLKGKMSGCSSLADQYWMDVLNQTILKEINSVWEVIPHRDFSSKITDVCEINGVSCKGREKRGAGAAAAILAISFLLTMLFDKWVGPSANNELSRMTETQEMIVDAIHNRTDFENNFQKLEKHTLLKMHDLMVDSYSGLYRDIRQTATSFNYQLLRFIIIDSFRN